MPDQNSNRAGGFVSIAPKTSREYLVIYLNSGQGTIWPEGDEEFAFRLPLKTVQTSQNKYANILFELSQAIAEKQPEDLNQTLKAKPVTDAVLDAMDTEILSMDEEASGTILDALRDIGTELRDSLPEQLIVQLEGVGFTRSTLGELGTEPALIFDEDIQKSDAHYPMLWDVMYEGGKKGLSSWKNFWGFRLPISYWVRKARPDHIVLSKGIFSAINEDLDYAQMEVDNLVQQAGFRLPHENLKDKFKNYLLNDSELRDKFGTNEILAWSESCPKDAWLGHFVENFLADKCTARELTQWKKDALVAVLDGIKDYELLHFACHCRPAKEADFLSSLELKVAGQSLDLSVDTLGAMQQKVINKKESGPLVFLNACGTAQQNQTWEPPGFVRKWTINRGALGVLVTLCPVPDYFAHAFARKFYKFLFEGLNHPADERLRSRQYLSEVLLQTRRYFMEKYNNPLGLAYVLYAFRNMWVELDPLTTGGNP